MLIQLLIILNGLSDTDYLYDPGYLFWFDINLVALKRELAVLHMIMHI